MQLGNIGLLPLPDFPRMDDLLPERLDAAEIFNAVELQRGHQCSRTEQPIQDIFKDGKFRLLEVSEHIEHSHPVEHREPLESPASPRLTQKGFDRGEHAVPVAPLVQRRGVISGRESSR